MCRLRQIFCLWFVVGLVRAGRSRPTARFIARAVKHHGVLGVNGSAAAALLFSLTSLGLAQEQAPDFPQFRVPGHEAGMVRLQEMFRLHHGAAFSDCTLWDAWLPHATLWTAVGAEPSAKAKREQYRGSLLNRRIDAEGYVSMHQHRGMAHSEGWPFPAWQQSTGMGWHFTTADEVYGLQNFALKALTTTDGWEISGAKIEGIDPVVGLKLSASSEIVTITTPAFACGTIVAPFARLEWAAQGLPAESRPRISWQLQGETEWKPGRGGDFAALTDADGMRFANVPLYRQPGYAGVLTRYRLTFDRAAGARLSLKSLITAIDTRHPITNANFLRGNAEYFAWTGDMAFLSANIGRMRKALRFALSEFQVRDRKLVRVPWVGHDGRSGLVIGADGKPQPRPGLGLGNNYYDLIPFGGDDALATIYYYDALRRMAELEREIAAHPDWKLPTEEPSFSSDDLTQLADAVKAHAGKSFWNEATGRFIGWQDTAGARYDYGFVFVNIEAVAYGFATPEQGRQIYDWLDGKRTVTGDTSQGADIYHWRLAPRATTRRNTQDYVWPWSAPQSIPWGDQIQDGGAVLGFSYYDLMARLQTNGPDDAWRRLREILTWFREVQTEGGYRAYYAKPGRGTMQGGGPPGGLGMDQEFLESVLVPQVMLYGFLGCTPRADGLHLTPRLPADWPELTVTQIHYRDHVFDITALPGELRFATRVAGREPIRLWLEPGRWEMTALDATGKTVAPPNTVEASQPMMLTPIVGQTLTLKNKPNQ